MKHIIYALVENKPGVLAKVSGLFARRGFNIESLSVGYTQSKEISRITIIVDGDSTTVEQVNKQLNKLINVIKVSDITSLNIVERELLLIKVKTDRSNRFDIIQIVDIFRGQVVDVGEDTMIIEMTGDEDKILAFENLVKRFGIVELVRTGKIALVRG